MGAQKNILIKTVVLSIHNICLDWDFYTITHFYLEVCWVSGNIDPVEIGRIYIIWKKGRLGGIKFINDANVLTPSAPVFATCIIYLLYMTEYQTVSKF